MSNHVALPAYLQNRQNRKLTADATAGLGASLPAHISTEGSVFTLIDAAGNEQRLTFTGQDQRQYQQPYLDVCIVDVNAATSKRYYGGKKYQKGAGDAPVCWSSNGIAPSRESAQQQSPTCDACPHNVRGSATSEMSGAAIKACRDEKWLAVSVPQIGLDTIFRYVVTPGSFKNWKAYTALFAGGAVDIGDVVTRMEWVGPDQPNVIKFSAIGYIDERTAQLSDQAQASKATDAIVGRNDVPALPMPAPQAALPYQQEQRGPTNGVAAASPSPPFALPLANAPPAAVSSSSPSATSPAPSAPSAQTPTSATPENALAPGRRRRNAPQAQPATSNAPLQAPFPHSAPPVTTAVGGGPSFGIQPGVTPDPALAATLASIFPQK